MRIAIVGGGINGLACAWYLAQRGQQVELFERGLLMRATSCASSKLLHGGLRYLEHGQFRLVREALRERDRWLQRAAHLARPLQLVIPIYSGAHRPRWQYGLGLLIYQLLSGTSSLRHHQWLDAGELLNRDPRLSPVGLRGGYAFTDGQMDDYNLGLWVAHKARDAGAVIRERTEISRIDSSGTVFAADGTRQRFDRVINVAGPWAEELSRKSGQELPFELDLVRGSHLLLDEPCPQAYLLENSLDRRVLFVLPWQGRTLIGTTEIRQPLTTSIACSTDEENYLLRAYNRYRPTPVHAGQIVDRISGLRPLVKSADDPYRATREYVIHRDRNAITVLGGKWTTCLALAEKVHNIIH